MKDEDKMRFLTSLCYVCYCSCIVLLQLLGRKSLVDNDGVLKMLENTLALDILGFVMYCIYRIPGTHVILSYKAFY